MPSLRLVAIEPTAIGTLREHLATFWGVRGVTDRDLTCSAYRVETGLELRADCSEEAMRTKRLTRGPTRGA